MIILFDTPLSRSALYPLSLTRPVCDIRHGILTMREYWQLKTSQNVYALTESYLQEQLPEDSTFICIDATVSCSDDCFEKIMALQPGEMLEDNNGLIAYATGQLPLYNQFPVWIETSIKIETQKRIKHASFLFQTNEERIREHYILLANGKESQMPAPSNIIIGSGNLFLEEGVQMRACIINASDGPVYIGKNAKVMEGALIHGPVAICENAVVKMGAKLYPGTTIGPYCTAGGEIKNSILTGFSNKAHDGYLGDSVIGEWCNLGAGTSNSNVKNTGSLVKMWDQSSRDFIPVGNKAGLIMGDYSRCAINSSINTGTTVGVCCNIFDGTYPDKHLPSFSWGNHEQYDFNKACSDAANWKKMKNKDFTEADRLILQHLFNTVHG